MTSQALNISENKVNNLLNQVTEKNNFDVIGTLINELTEYNNQLDEYIKSIEKFAI